MKSKIVILSAIFLFSAIEANACNRADDYICKGDTVFYDDIRSTVIGMSQNGNKVAIENWRGIQTVPHDDLSVGVGCVLLYCIGDNVVDQTSYGRSGTIVGVNPVRGRITFKHSSGVVSTRHFDDLALGIGCSHGYCVGDEVIVDDRRGTVFAFDCIIGTIWIQYPGQNNIGADESDITAVKLSSKYGKHARSERIYPEINVKKYLDSWIAYSLKRPI